MTWMQRGNCCHSQSILELVSGEPNLMLFSQDEVLWDMFFSVCILWGGMSFSENTHITGCGVHYDHQKM